jgi:CBS domain-containing protein
LLGWYVPEVLGVGYGNVSLALNGQIVLGTMALLVVLKVVATATCYASGNAGGIFGPALFMGAMTGGALGGAAHLLLPDYTGSVGAYALVGMGAAFAGIIRVPLTSVIMIFEITRDYSIIVPLMIANLISYFISSRLQKEPIYEALQHQDGVYLPAGARDRQELALVSSGIRPVSLVLRGDDTVAGAAASTGGVRNSWVVVGQTGVLGMITTEQLEQAVKAGRGQDRLADLVPGPAAYGSASGRYPHVHADHPLDTAMRRMADAGVDVLPVISRSDLRKVMGVISLQDVLDAYGFGDRRSRGEEPPDDFRAPVAKLVVVVAVIAGMLLAAVSLGYVYRVRRAGQAQQYFQTANGLVGNGRYSEAVEQYRNALSISHNSEHRLALALALVKAQRLNEAEIYLREVLRDHPTSGPANLGIAQVDAAEGRSEDAVIYYHRALYGAWPANAAEHKVQAHIELVEALGKAGRNKQAQVELLSLIQELPSDPAVRKKVAHLLLAFGLPQESAQVFSDVLQTSDDDEEAYTGLGDADAVRWNYRSACDAYRHALKIKPADEAIGQRLELCERVLALDPSLAGLRSAERFRRSQRLLELVLAALDQCRASYPEAPLPGSGTQLADRARENLASRRQPQSYGDAADEDVAMARQLWESRPTPCRSPEGSDDAVNRVIAHLSR